MANIFKSENLENDFEDFTKALFNTNKFITTITVDIKPYVKKQHNFIYIIALLQFKLEKLYSSDFHRYAFVSEIQSDLLSNISLIFLGFYHQSQISIRRIIENFYNHIYYFNHSVEFELLNDGKNEYQPIMQLKDYLDSHPLIKKLSDKNTKDFNQDIINHYQELCRTVHTKGIKFMGLAKTIEDIKVKFDVSDHLSALNLTLSHVVYLLYKFHTELSFTKVETDLIAKTFPKNIRQSLLS